MKIIFHLNSMGRGGAEHVVSILSQKLSEAGNDVIVATQWYSENEYKLADRVKRLDLALTDEEEKKGRVSKAFTRLFKLRNCFKNEKPDLVISFCSKANFRSAFSLIGTKTPLIVSVRNNPVEDYKGHFLATKIMEKKACGCVFQTPDAMSFFSKPFQDKSRIIFNPIAQEYLDPQTKRHNAESRRILNVGRISRQKNQLLLLKAFKRIADKYPEYRLTIFGDVQEKDVYEEMTGFVKNNNLEGRVEFPGSIDDIKSELEETTLFVLSSDFEGMPNSLIEAMAMGVPCISTDCPCGGSRMLIDNEKNGLLVPIKDEEALFKAMDRVLGNPELSESFGEQAVKVLDKVNPDKICKEWEDFIREKIK
nr:glycosyltransferase [uncultured Butyrivibrio sp.]